MGEMAEWSMTDHPDDNDYPEKKPMTDKRLEEIRERLKLVQAGKPNTLHALNMADSMARTDMPYLLDLVDTQAKRIEETKTFHKEIDEDLVRIEGGIDRVKERGDDVIALYEFTKTQLDNANKQITEGRGLLADWTLDYVREDPGRVIINECTECRNIIDGWDKGHKEGCKVGAWMAGVSDYPDYRRLLYEGREIVRDMANHIDRTNPIIKRVNAWLKVTG